VPAIWSLEVANVLARAESRGLITEAQSRAFLALLAALPIQLEPVSADAPFGVILDLARRYRLSAYDAAYLELALRTQSPLASIDRALRSAAASAGVAMAG
jgi:predicted nucleic acid-binding protein